MRGPRYFDATAVSPALPPVEDQLRIAEQLLRHPGRDRRTQSLAEVRPRASASKAYALATFDDLESSQALLGVSWVTEWAGRSSGGQPTLHAVVILDDPDGARPRAVLDGTRIVCARSAAVCGVAIRHFGPQVRGRPVVAGLIGAGARAAAHLETLAFLEPGVSVAVWDHDHDPADELVGAAARVSGVGTARAVHSAREAAADADILIVTTLPGPGASRIRADWFGKQPLIFAEHGTESATADVARTSSLLMTDDPHLFELNRAAARFAEFPPITQSIGDALATDRGRTDGRVFVLAVGLSAIDLAFASWVYDRLGSNPRPQTPP